MNAGDAFVPREIGYRLRAGAGGHRPGAHRSVRGDAGMAFRGHRPLSSGGDARRIDVHASLRDPLHRWWLRVHAEHRAVPVVLLADLSASMAYVGERRRVDVLADLTASLAWSAERAGDPFGFVGFDRGLPPSWQLAPTRRRGAGAVLAAALRGHAFDGADSRGVDAIVAATGRLPRQRSLIFLASDFHWPAGLLDDVVDRCAGHELMPVVIWDRSEFRLPARNGLAWLRDAEGAGEHLLWVRPSLRRRHADRLEQAGAALRAQLARRQLRSAFLLDGFDADAVTAACHG